MKNRITDGTEKRSLVEEGQQGYCEGKPCLTDLLEFGEGASEHIDKGTSQLHILGFSNFDKVLHQSLLRN